MPRYVRTRSTEHLANLLSAIKANNLAEFKLILEVQGLPSSRNNADYKLLKKALVYGRSRMAEILLDRGCRAYKRFPKGNSPLHLAASRHNCSKLVRRLLDHGAKVDQKNRADQTPLHVAFNSGETTVIDLMLEEHLRSSFANESNAIGMTYLHIAATRRPLNSVRGLVEVGGAFVNCQIDKKADSPFAGFTPLHMTVQFHNPKVAELLLNNGADLWARDCQGSTPLHLALERKNVEMMELLFKYDYKRENYVNNFGLSHFMAACLISDPSVAKEYLSNPVNSKTVLINERVDKFTDLTYPFKNYTPLHFAAEYGRGETVQLLLVNGARVRTRNSSGLMPKHLSLINGYYEAADLFVMHCLRYEWSLDITALKINEDEEDVEQNMVCEDDDSGYFEEDISDRGVSYDDSDDDSFSSSFSYVSDDSYAMFWEDDIADYMLDEF